MKVPCSSFKCQKQKYLFCKVGHYLVVNPEAFTAASDQSGAGFNIFIGQVVPSREV